MVVTLCRRYPIYSVSWVRGMTAQIVEGKIYPYELEVAHSKSGQDHVLIIKSLKVRSDDLPSALEQLDSALKVFNTILRQ